MTSKIEICNLALSRLGDKSTIESIDSPSKPQEQAFAKWYDITRRTVLRQNMPSFAIFREFWLPDGDYKPAFGYENAYRMPTTCLKVLGIDEIPDTRNDYAVEGGYLLCDRYYKGGIPVRYVKDIQNPDRFTPDFIELLSWELARNVCAEITNDTNMLSYIDNVLASVRIELSGVDSQENKPIRVAHSMFDRTGFTYKGLDKK